MNNVVNIVTNYLLQSKEFEGVRINKQNHFEVSSKHCIKNEIDSIFKLKEKIPCNYYDQVVNGEGNEKEKISAVYSSSLQSLLFFAWVSKDNPLTININDEEISFTDVCFEYKNKVIGYPSSVDVVLTDGVGKNILFIESKLIEILRDSDKEGKAVVGKSYFNDQKYSSYYQALNLDKDALAEIGIKKDDAVIRPLSPQKYVYSYGVKQMLAHVIGINNFINDENKNDQRCSNELRNYQDANVYFMELYNAFPGIEGSEEGFLQPHKDYEEHINKVIEVVQKKNTYEIDNPKEMFIKAIKKRAVVISYQKLYLESQKSVKPYRLSQNIVDFYHLID